VCHDLISGESNVAIRENDSGEIVVSAHELPIESLEMCVSVLQSAFASRATSTTGEIITSIMHV
jgi:hypothetical protein